MSGGYSVTGVQIKKVSLSSVQILSLFTSPVTLLAAVGAGYLYDLVTIYARHNFGTAAYVGNIAVQMNSVNISRNSAILTTTTTTVFNMVMDSASAPYLSTQPLVIAGVAADPTTGDGTLDVYIHYNVIVL